MNLFNTRKELNLPEFADIILKVKENETFEKYEPKKGRSVICLYEGPLRQTGFEIHHVMARTIKDVFVGSKRFRVIT